MGHKVLNLAFLLAISIEGLKGVYIADDGSLLSEVMGYGGEMRTVWKVTCEYLVEMMSYTSEEYPHLCGIEVERFGSDGDERKIFDE